MPFYLQAMQLDLVAEAKDLVDSIQFYSQAPPALVVLDTLNRSLCGSENRDEDMSAYVKAVDIIRQAFDCAVLVVHHSGVEALDLVGHTSLTGAADAQLSIKRDDNHLIVTVEAMKDGRQGDALASRLIDDLEVGIDSKGAPITSCVLEGTELTPAQTERGNKLPKNHASMLGILDDAGSDGLTVEEWNDLARKEGLGVRRRMDLMDYRKALKKKKLVYEFDERWFISRG